MTITLDLAQAVKPEKNRLASMADPEDGAWRRRSGACASGLTPAVPG